MINFINNGGFEFILATLYFAYILILTRIEGGGRSKKEEKPVKWHW